MILPKKVSNFFIINFKVGSVDQKFCVLRHINRLKNMFKCPWNDSSLCSWLSDAHHAKALATASLTICKHCAIVSFTHTLDKWETYVIIDCLGNRIDVVCAIKRE